MDVFAIAAALRRHLSLTIIVALLTTAGALILVLLMPRQYEAQASYVLVNPVPGPTDAEIQADPSLAEVNRNNPYLRFGNQATVGQVLAGRVSGDAVRESLISQGADKDYTIAPSADYGGAGQVIDITGTGTSPEQAQITLRIVTSTMTQQLADMQKVYGAADESLITALPVAEPSGARAILSGLVRSLVGVVAAGVIVLFAAISVAEARRSRRAGGGEEASVGSDDVAVPKAAAPSRSLVDEGSPDEAESSEDERPKNPPVLPVASETSSADGSTVSEGAGPKTAAARVPVVGDDSRSQKTDGSAKPRNGQAGLSRRTP